MKQIEIDKIQKELEDSNRRYQNLHDNIPVGVYRRTPGPEGKMLIVNPALVKMFGYLSAQELNQIPIVDLYYDPEQCKPFSKKLFSDRQVIKEQLKMKKKDGSPIWVSVSATVVYDNSDDSFYFDGIMEDISSQKKILEQEDFQRQKLIQADKMISLGILVSGVAHEINNPNQFVVSHLGVLKKVWVDAVPVLDSYMKNNGDFKLGGLKYSVVKKKMATAFTNMTEGTQRITHIVNELRNYAREQPAKADEDVNVNQVIKSALSLLNNLIVKSTTAFYVTYYKEIPIIKGDFQKIEQVVINLVQNACQALAGDQKEISITTSYNSESSKIIVQVDDTGSGISEENMGRIRDPFFTTKRESMGGTGLGLSISEGIVSDHGGTMEFTSQPCEGTTVKMFLPVTKKKLRKN